MHSTWGCQFAGLKYVHASSVSKAAIIKIAKCFRLLPDLQFCFSLARRAFIILSFNFLGKSASDVILIDDCLFGNNLAEEINAAQTIKEVAHKISKKAQLSSQKLTQPATHRFKQLNY